MGKLVKKPQVSCPPHTANCVCYILHRDSLFLQTSSPILHSVFHQIDYVRALLMLFYLPLCVNDSKKGKDGKSQGNDVSLPPLFLERTLQKRRNITFSCTSITKGSHFRFLSIYFYRHTTSDVWSTSLEEKNWLRMRELSP